MNHQDALSRLDEFFDGTLSAREHREVEDHLAECAVCRDELAALGALMDTVADLRERRTEPEHDLWPGIDQRIRARHAPVDARARRLRFGGSAKGLGWVLVPVTVAAVCVLTLVLRPQIGRLAPATSTLSQRGMDAQGAEAMTREIAALDAQVVQTRQSLLPSVAADSSAAAGGSWKLFVQSLQVLDQAVRESRAALERDPSNPVVQRSLLAAYQKQLDLLRWASRLVHQG